MIALYVVACLQGSLHGAPKDICREIPIRSYIDATSCTHAAPAAISEWKAGLRRINIDVYVPPVDGWRCGPREDRGS